MLAARERAGLATKHRLVMSSSTPVPGSVAIVGRIATSVGGWLYVGSGGGICSFQDRLLRCATGVVFAAFSSSPSSVATSSAAARARVSSA